MTDEEKKKDLEKLKKDLGDYLRIAPLIGATPEEIKRVTNRFLDDIQRVINKK